MKMTQKNNNMKALIIALFMMAFAAGFSQDADKFKLNPEKVSKFQIYLAHYRGYTAGTQAFEDWKANNKMLYTKEMWYFSESFYIKKNAYSEGENMDESVIDVSRFENLRKENEEMVIKIDGIKDAVVLIPGKDLLHKFVLQQ